MKDTVASPSLDIFQFRVDVLLRRYTLVTHSLLGSSNNCVKPNGLVRVYLIQRLS